MNTWEYDDPFLQVLEKPDQMPSGYHAPVMPEEVMAFLCPAPGKLFLDGTCGGGGHTELFLQAGADVVALDQDADAMAHCGERFVSQADRLYLARANFAQAGEVVEQLGLGALDGALLDLGVSSHQLDTAERGFSFQREGPLDMRMDQQGSMSAAVLLNTAAEEELAKIFRDYGEEPRARAVASRIVEIRGTRPFRTTTDLAQAVESVIARSGARHPATRVFQALRIAVNDELGALERALEVISGMMAPHGRFGVITFHSLEDRIVKHFFRERSVEWIDRPEWPEPRRNPNHIFRLLTPRPIDASTQETQTNPRARSAKLRVAERIETDHEN
ncbi:MAG: 16S rRNA (cytosine(1402)-N(4))-methyltransferase RsmH [Terrimicrobiaceae bacterium]